MGPAPVSTATRFTVPFSADTVRLSTASILWLCRKRKKTFGNATWRRGCISRAGACQLRWAALERASQARCGRARLKQGAVVCMAVRKQTPWWAVAVSPSPALHNRPGIENKEQTDPCAVVRGASCSCREAAHLASFVRRRRAVLSRKGSGGKSREATHSGLLPT